MLKLGTDKIDSKAREGVPHTPLLQKICQPAAAVVFTVAVADRDVAAAVIADPVAPAVASLSQLLLLLLLLRLLLLGLLLLLLLLIIRMLLLLLGLSVILLGRRSCSLLSPQYLLPFTEAIGNLSDFSGTPCFL